MPPGTGDVQMGLARMLPRTDLIIITTIVALVAATNLFVLKTFFANPFLTLLTLRICNFWCALAAIHFAVDTEFTI